MKKLSLCALLAGAMFGVSGLIAFAHVSPQPKPLPLFFPLMWDFAMVAIGSSCLFHCACARRAALVWSFFCVLASLAVGATALDWLTAQPPSPLGEHRLIFMVLTTAFGVVYSVWQLFALIRSPRGELESVAVTTPVHHS